MRVPRAPRARRYEAIHCATDSFKTLEDVPTGTGLGDLKFVAEGLLLMIRPKLYVMFSNEIAERVAETGDLREYLKSVDINSLRYPEDIVKYAHHGFWGGVHQLLELYRDKSNHYLTQHMTKIRESIRQNKKPLVMETQVRRINIDWERARSYMLSQSIQRTMRARLYLNLKPWRPHAPLSSKSPMASPKSMSATSRRTRA